MLLTGSLTRFQLSLMVIVAREPIRYQCLQERRGTDKGGNNLPRDKTYFHLQLEVTFMPPGLDKLLKFCLLRLEQLLLEDEGMRPGIVNNFLNWKHC